jgi:hypothetical protein
MQNLVALKSKNFSFTTVEAQAERRVGMMSLKCCLTRYGRMDGLNRNWCFRIRSVTAQGVPVLKMMILGSG